MGERQSMLNIMTIFTLTSCMPAGRGEVGRVEYFKACTVGSWERLLAKQVKKFNSSLK
jgi:hypothetical protein